MKAILNHLFEHKLLSKQQAKEVLFIIAKGDCNNSQIAAFLSVFLMRSVTVGELEGFRDALLELCLRLDFSAYETIDLCGTGGDSKNTFNISTLASFVVAGAGIKVAKHGNYGVSSVSGSSNVMEYLGYKFTNDKSVLEKQIAEVGICFMHAPLFHPAMKTVAPIRKELGVKTFFNMLGPLVNPSFPKYQLTGVFNLELARLYNYLLQQTEKQYIIVHSLDGYDEVSLTSNFKMVSKTKEQIFEPENLGFEKLKQEDLFGGETIKQSAEIFLNILNGAGTKAQNAVVTANAAMAIKAAHLQPFPKGREKTLQECIAEAKESLESKKALNVFKKLIWE